MDDGGGEAGHFFCRTITPLNLRRPTHSQAPQPTFHLEFLKELRAFISLPTLSFDFLGTIAFLCRSLSDDRASVAAVREKRYLEQVPTQTVHLHLVSHSTTCEDSFLQRHLSARNTKITDITCILQEVCPSMSLCIRSKVKCGSCLHGEEFPA